MDGSPLDEAAVVALAARLGAGQEEVLGPVEDVDDDRVLGLDERVELGLEEDDDVLQALDDAAVDADAQLALRRLAAQLVARAAEELARLGAQRRLVEQRRHGVVQVRRDGDAAAPSCSNNSNNNR